jgi:hypothetical protein
MRSLEHRHNMHVVEIHLFAALLDGDNLSTVGLGATGMHSIRKHSRFAVALATILFSIPKSAP